MSERDEDPGREVRVEGAGLLVVGGLLLAAVLGAFFLGRWVERRAQPPSLTHGALADPLEHVVESEPPADAQDGLDYFDSLAGAEKEREPAREAQRQDPAPARAEPVQPQAGEAEAGAFYVQVFAGRDRGASEGLVTRLRGSGYGVRVFSEREGQGALFKVRVGGYPTEERARAVAAELKKAGYSGAWVTRVE